MMTRFRTSCRLLLPALFLAGTAAAQEAPPTVPLAADPGRAIYAPTAAQQAQRGTTALPLPFFDDFTSPLEGAPKLQNWMPKGGAFVSNRYALRPLTRGAVTLDGLNAAGRSYSGAISAPNDVLDSLVSQTIDLGGQTTSSAVYLSFAWQAGSIARIPSNNNSGAPVRLDLYVKTNAGVWEPKWSATSTGQRTGFRQQVIDLNQAKYLHGAFQFMFVATGNTTINTDNWSIDYVLLNNNRTATDTTFRDVATGAGLVGGNPSGGLRSPLAKYSSMPVWQFNASPATELNPTLGVNLTNLNPNFLPVEALGTLRVLPAGASLGAWLQNPTVSVTGNTRQFPLSSPATTLPPPNSGTPKTLRYTLALNTQELTPRTLPNDTISRDVELNNYYAYDDGTAESTFFILPFTTGTPAALAYRFDLNQPDFVRGLRLYPVYPGTALLSPSTTGRIFDFDARTVTISVWDVVAGLPAATPRSSKTVTIPAAASIPASWQYYQIDFDQPVPVSGSFFVGFSQPASSLGRYLLYGLDRNSAYPVGYMASRTNAGVWSAVEYFIDGTTIRGGAPMMRPVMTNNVATATASAREAAAYGVYPNPAHGTVTVEGPAFARATLLDALGRTVWEQPAAQAGRPTLDLPNLSAGVYTVRLSLADGRIVSRRLMLE